MQNDPKPLDDVRRLHQMADDAKALRLRLTAERDAAPTKAERRKLNSRIHSIRIVERFFQALKACKG